MQLKIVQPPTSFILKLPERINFTGSLQFDCFHFDKLFELYLIDYGSSFISFNSHLFVLHFRIFLFTNIKKKQTNT